MSKRFTETEVWDDPWFRRLPACTKLFWKYICDKADMVGTWKVDFELAEFVIGCKLDPESILQSINFGKERVKILESGSLWFLTDFIKFQYGNLSPKCSAHRGILNRVNKLRVTKGLPNPSITLVDMDMDKVQNNNNSNNNVSVIVNRAEERAQSHYRLSALGGLSEEEASVWMTRRKSDAANSI